MLGAKFRPRSFAAVDRAAQPISGSDPEVIWHQVFDTQTYLAAGANQLVFFNSVNNDKTLNNMELAGQFPNPQTFQIYNVCLDLLPLSGVSTAAGGVAGNLDDMARILMVARPTWTLTLQNKQYGGYSLTALRGTGGPTGFGWGTFTAEESLQFAKNDPSMGWNYQGQIIIPAQASFNITVNFPSLVTITADTKLRLSMFGVLNRAVK